METNILHFRIFPWIITFPKEDLFRKSEHKCKIKNDDIQFYF